MSGDNPSGAGDQQERPELEGWIVGFVDGEGCFSCPIHPSPSMKIDWQIQPRFAVVQGERSAKVLELIQSVLGCGRIYRNRRHDNHREHLMVYSVYRQQDLREKVIPFFEAHPLRTAKHEEFTKFTWVLEMMERRLHLTVPGLREIAKVVQTMNHRKPSRFLESSEAIRQPALIDVGVEDMVPSSWRHEGRGAKFLVG
jgi:hypothetical protein